MNGIRLFVLESLAAIEERIKIYDLLVAFYRDNKDGEDV